MFFELPLRLCAVPNAAIWREISEIDGRRFAKPLGHGALQCGLPGERLVS
jgi:hypothetical protein